MAQTLYRKYRPLRWSDVVGQDHVVKTLTNELRRNALVHAYLFTGPRGVGKTTSARLLAKAANCTGRADAAEPCETCPQCVAFAGGQAIDIIEIDAASHTGVDMVREHIIENARFLPTQSRYKVFIIDEVHMLSTSAFNALLKTLEEPPAHALFILATTEIDKLLATIRSRCEEYVFRRVPHALIVEKLRTITTSESREVADDVIAQIASNADGCLRDAESLLGQVLSLTDGPITMAECEHILPRVAYKEAIAILEAIGSHNAMAGLAVVDSLADNATEFHGFANQLIDVARLVLLAMHRAVMEEERARFDEESLARLGALAKTFTPTRITTALTTLLQARIAINTAPLPQLPIEIAIVELCNDAPQAAPVVHQTSSVSPTQFTTAPAASVASTSDAGSSRALPPAPQPPAPAASTSTTSSTARTPLSNAPLTLTLDNIKSRWNKFLEFVGEKNPSTMLLLRMAVPTTIEGNKLRLECGFALHADKLREPKIKFVAEEFFATFFAERADLDCSSVTMVQQSTPDVVSPEAAALAAEFEGQVVG
ncbi:MAG: DNA polymerase III subunit gamma/tau [Patescibacteria group bacterium]